MSYYITNDRRAIYRVDNIWDLCQRVVERAYGKKFSARIDWDKSIAFLENGQTTKACDAPGARRFNLCVTPTKNGSAYPLFHFTANVREECIHGKP